jgi:hypothetical protein
MGGSGAWSIFQDDNDRRSNMIVYCRDKTTETVEEVIARARQYIDTQSLLPDAQQKYRLAGGAMGVQAAINETLEKYQLATMLLAFLGVFISCSVLMRSCVGGLILLLPVILSNTVMFACMALSSPAIPITTATLPVSAISVGIGVDFAIYLASRIREECAITGDLRASVINAMGTTGKAVVYFAVTLICGLFFWIFSKLMFPAIMAFMLTASLLLNILGAIFIVPSLTLFIKPKCILSPAVDLKNGVPLDMAPCCTESEAADE